MRCFLVFALACLCASGCETEQTHETTKYQRPGNSPGVTADTSAPTSSADLADAQVYLAAKAAYVRKYDSAQEYAGMPAALADLDRRARAILGPLPFPNAAWKISLDAIPVKGNQGGEQLDGLQTRIGNAEVIATTPELLLGWVRFMGDSSGDPMKSLGMEDMLTWAFFDDAHAYPFGDLRTKGVAIPSDVFIAQLIAEGQDTGASSPEKLIVGVDRGKHIYLIKAPLETAMPRADACGAPTGDSYHRCYGEKVAGLAGFQDAVKQVARLSAMIPK